MKLCTVVPAVFLLSFFNLFLPVAAQSEPVNLLSLQEGCLPVVVPPTYSGWDAQYILDDSASSGWASEQGHVNNNVFVFEMAFEATLERFEFDTASIDTEGAAAKDIIVEVSKTSVKDGYEQILKISLENSKSYPILTEVLALLKTDFTTNLSIEGHTDSTGSAERNKVLSGQRAESVKAYLVAGGITAVRLTTAGLGPSVPVADNGTELGRAQNRRVELVRK